MTSPRTNKTRNASPCLAIAGVGVPDVTSQSATRTQILTGMVTAPVPHHALVTQRLRAGVTWLSVYTKLPLAVSLTPRFR